MTTRQVMLCLWCFAAFLGLGVSAALAQDEAATCAALQDTAFTQTGTLCATTGTNTVCYGNPLVVGSFRANSTVGSTEKLNDPDFFTQPGNQADLLLTESIQAGPLDLAAVPATWGIATMNAQAGLPDKMIQALNGKGAIYVLLGDVEVENGVEPANAPDLPDTGVAVATISAADMRLSPVARDTAAGTNVIARIPSETNLSADAITPDGNWVRVVYGEQVGWISRATLPPSANLSSVIQLLPDMFTPMQSFYFRTGSSNPDCLGQPSLLLVQGPENTAVNLRVHGIDIRLESTALMRTIPPGDTLGDYFDIITLYGMITVFPDTDQQILVPPGFIVRFQLGTFTSLGIEGDEDEKTVTGVVGTIFPLTPEEIDILKIVEQLPSNILHYVPEVPRFTTPSGIGQAVGQLVFINPAALNHARRACANGQLAAPVCETLGL